MPPIIENKHQHNQQQQQVKNTFFNRIKESFKSQSLSNLGILRKNQTSNSSGSSNSSNKTNNNRKSAFIGSKEDLLINRHKLDSINFKYNNNKQTIRSSMTDLNNNNNNNRKPNAILTPNTQKKQFIPLKSATANGKVSSSDNNMQRSRSNNDNRVAPSAVNGKGGKSAKGGGKKDPKNYQVDMHELDATLLPNSKHWKSKQDTSALTHSIAKESWNQNYKECMRHARLAKDDNLEKTCPSCNIIYVLCEACRNEREIPFNDDDTCIDCAPSAYTVRGLIQKKDAIIRELHYKAHRMEDDCLKFQKETDRLKQSLTESEQLRQEMQEDYRKSVSECMSRENENVELVQKLAAAIKEIHQLQVSTKTHEELIEDLNKLLKSGDYSDCQVIISATGERIPLHRNILAARSEYFKSMITDPQANNNKKGGNNNSIISLDNINRDNANQILEYIYCGKCRDINNDHSAVDLYDLATRLGLISLKDVVVDYYVRKLNRNNCFDVAAKTVFIQKNSEKYKDYIKNYILTECSDLIELNSTNEQWRKLKETNPLFVVELLELKMQKDEKKYKKFASLRQINEETAIDGSQNPNDPSVAPSTTPTENNSKLNSNSNSNLKSAASNQRRSLK